MSRKIRPKTSVSITEEQQLNKRADTGKLLFTVYQNRNCALYIQNNRLLTASFFPETSSRIGAVYIGKIKNMAPNIDACFVEISGKEICFLSLKNASAPYLLNRNYDGHLVEGDELLVQVTKDSHNTKRASVTTQISLANDYFALTMGTEKTGFSLKLSNEKKRALENLLTEKGILKNSVLVQNDELLSILEKIEKENDCFKAETELNKPQLNKPEINKPEKNVFKKYYSNNTCLPPMGCVIRTKAGESAPEELLSHFLSLSLQFINLLYTARYRSCFSCLKDAPADFESVFQQLPVNVMSRQESESPADNSSSQQEEQQWEIVTDQAPLQEQLKKYCNEHNIHVNVRLYQDSLLPLSVLYSIESKLSTALTNRVWLKSGGYLIIEPTEALTVIDVNSGKYESGKTSQETYRTINLEAAEEVAIQLRLRNLSGIIIVDFINMKSPDDRQMLLNHLRALTSEDRIPTKIIDMTPLGLVEITRKKINKTLKEQFQYSYSATY